ncbi:MAG: hypothetical protein ACRBB0_25490 [Pelagimonas sp.]|uniref:hypothetical protein n=1 Tax=Pelagimonas sp. TaxID=2073170 RepID=UPI003D6B8F8F
MGLIEQFITLQNLALALDALGKRIEEETCREAEFDLYCEHDRLLDTLCEHIQLMTRTNALRSALQAFSASDIGGKLVAEHGA